MIATLIALAAAATAATPPVIGAWDWNPIGAQCHEVHTYNADGSMRTESGSEVLTKTYTATPAKGGMWKIEATVTASNGGKDCTGSPTAVGRSSTVYIQPLNDGGYFTCASEDGMSCYGNARRRKP